MSRLRTPAASAHRFFTKYIQRGRKLLSVGLKEVVRFFKDGIIIFLLLKMYFVITFTYCQDESWDLYSGS